MKQKSSTWIIFVALLLPWSSPTPAAVACSQTCGGWKLPFPFGFSSACQIQLNCTANGTVLAADFPVLSITGDTIKVNVPADCGRPIVALGRLFTLNYAPNFMNAVLLHNCSGGHNPCFIPTTTVKANFELTDCGRKNDSISCYSEPDNRTLYLDYQNLRRSGCQSLFSAISIESLEKSPPILDVRIIRLGWWILGKCSCSKHAKCYGVLPPLEGNPPAYRCKCTDGFVGDGFSAGVGCRKESQGCNFPKYISGRCGGDGRIPVLVGGGAAVVAFIASAAFVLCFIKRRTNLRKTSRRQRCPKLTETTDITIPVYPYKEMEKATNNFSDKKMLGTGAYGTVYSGKLSNDKWVAIKRIKNRDEHVINEIKLLSSVRHPNLVQLLGCSVENEHILVYEFMPNGTLCQHLHGEKGSGLEWRTRLNVAVETARALSYLHNELHPPIYHRDVKSSNILLDYTYKSKVADFGLSRLGMVELSHVSTAPQGTPGYVDPQYHQHFHLSDKSDVYSFGVVLVEIITALRVVDFARPPNEINLAALALDRISRGCLEEIIDPYILKSDKDVSTVYKVAELAFRCLAFERDERPSMMEVAVELEQIARSNKPDMISASSSSNLRKNKSVDSVEDVKTDFSPISSVEADSWQSEESSLTSNGLPNSTKVG